MVQPIIAAVPMMPTPPPYSAELSLTVQSVSVSSDDSPPTRPPPCWAELSLMVQSVIAAVPPMAAPPPYPAELPKKVQSVSDSCDVTPLIRPPPLAVALTLPPVIVRPEIVAVTPPPTSKTRLVPPPLMVTPAAGPVIDWAPPVSDSSSGLPPRVIVSGVLNADGLKMIVFAWLLLLALAIAAASDPVPDALMLETVNVARSRRASSCWSSGRSPRWVLSPSRGALARPDRDELFHGTIRKVSRRMMVPFPTELENSSASHGPQVPMARETKGCSRSAVSDRGRPDAKRPSR